MASLFDSYIASSEQTIYACISGEGVQVAVSVVRLSGQKIWEDFSRFCDLKKVPQARVSALCHFINPDTKEIIDQVLISYFPAPHSYTGEDIIEISFHGNPLILKTAFSLMSLSSKFRHALPGEFTFRAYKNKKMSFGQVEGLEMLLNAQSSYGLGHGIDLLSGELNKAFLELQAIYTKLRASAELSIDFLEDVGEEESAKQINNSFQEFSRIVKGLALRCSSPDSDLINPCVSLVGPVNAGKSTLFNILLGHDRAIVSDIAGTTRDYLSESISLPVGNFRLIDTAGIRDNEFVGVIEKEGIRRGVEKSKGAFYKILVLSVLSIDELDSSNELGELNLIVLSHVDCISAKELGSVILALGQQYQGVEIISACLTGPIGADGQGQSGPIGAGGQGQSGPIGAGGQGQSGSIGADDQGQGGPIGPLNNKDEVEKRIKVLISDSYKGLVGDQPLLSVRQTDAIKKLSIVTDEFGQVLCHEDDIGIITHSLKDIEESLSQLIGIIKTSEVLDSIFSNFCIGK